MLDYDFRPPPPPPPPPKPKPTPAPKPEDLQHTDAAQARTLVDQLKTPADLAAFQHELAQLPAGRRADLANALVGKLDAPRLVRMEQPFGKDAIEQAVSAYGNAAQKAAYELQHTLAEPKVAQGLKALGLGADDVAAAADRAAPSLIDAAKAAADGKYPDALRKLEDAAKAGEPLAARCGPCWAWPRQ